MPKGDPTAPAGATEAEGDGAEEVAVEIQTWIDEETGVQYAWSPDPNDPDGEGQTWVVDPDDDPDGLGMAQLATEIDADSQADDPKVVGIGSEVEVDAAVAQATFEAAGFEDRAERDTEGAALAGAAAAEPDDAAEEPELDDSTDPMSLMLRQEMQDRASRTAADSAPAEQFEVSQDDAPTPTEEQVPGTPGSFG